MKPDCDIWGNQTTVKEHTYTHTQMCTHMKAHCFQSVIPLNPALDARGVILSFSRADSVLCGLPEKLDYSINDKTVKLV